MAKLKEWPEFTPDPACSGTRHGPTKSYFERYRCRCPEAVLDARAAKRKWRHSSKGKSYVRVYRKSEREKAAGLRLLEKQKERAEIGLILDDWVWIGPYVGWSAEAAAPRIGVGYDRFLKILREAREAGDPRGVIPETVGGVRLYHAA